MKIVVYLLGLYLAVKAIKTFKPIVKEISSLQAYNAIPQSNLQSKRIRAFKSKYFKVQLLTLFICLAGVYIFNGYATTQVDSFLDEEYDNLSQPTKYVFGDPEELEKGQ